MADDLEPIRQVFESDLEPYVTPMREGYDEAKRFADENKIASDDVRELGQEASHSGDEIRAFAEQNKLAIDGLEKLRNEALEDGRALSSLRDHELEAGTEAGHLRDEAVEASVALGHLRDEALEASHEVKNLGDKSEETAAKLDLMGLSGASTLSSLGPLLGVIGALVAAAAGAAPALAGMGMGLGAFGLFALPTIKAVTGALKDNKAQLAALPAPIRDVVNQIKGLSTEWHHLSAAFQAPTLRIFSQFLSIASSLLPKLIPLANAGATAFSHIATAIGQGLNSSGFANFLHTMTALVVPATDAIIKLGGAIFGVLGHALVALAPLSVPFIGLITALIHALGGPIVAALHVVVSLIVGLGKAIEPLLPGLSKLATMLITDVGSGFQSFIPIISQIIQLLGGSLIRILLDLEPIFANALTPNSGFMLALGLIPGLLRLILPLFETLAQILGNPMFSRIVVDAITLVVAFKGLMGVISLVRGAFIALTAVMEVNPIILIATAIGLLVLAFITLWQHSAAFRDFWKAVWHDILDVVKAVWAAISPIVKVGMAVITGEIQVGMAIVKAAWTTIWDAIRIVVTTVWNVIKAEVTGAINTVKGIIQFVMDVIHGHWSAAWNDLVSIARTQITMVSTVIRTVASGFIHLLLQAGKDVIQGLINGIESMIGAVMNVVGQIGHAVSSAFSSVLHIFSPSLVFFQHGRNTLLGYINGVLSMIPQARAAMQQVAGSLPSPSLQAAAISGISAMMAPGQALPTGGTAGGGSPGPTGNLVVNVDGRKLFEILQSQLYQYNVRNSGQVTGTVKPA